MGAKPRSDSVLKNLPQERQELIVEWATAPKTETCVGGLRYAQEQLAADGLQVSVRALSEFCAWFRLQASFSGAENFARSVEEALRKQPGLTSEAISEAGQLAFTVMATSAQDSEEFRQMERLRLDKETAKTRARQKDADLKLAERRVGIMERKMKAAAQEVQKLRDPKKELTETDRQAILSKVDELLLGKKPGAKS